MGTRILITKCLAISSVVLVGSCYMKPETALEGVDAKLSTFAKFQDPSALSDAMLIVERTSDRDGRGVRDLRARREKARAYLLILRSINDSLDARPEQSIPPDMNIAPPAGSQLPSGVDPEAIKDPVLRKQYESALAENRAKLAARHERNVLQRHQKEFEVRILSYLRLAYPKTPNEEDELNQLCGELGVRQEFRARMQSR